MASGGSSNEAQSMPPSSYSFIINDFVGFVGWIVMDRQGGGGRLRCEVVFKWGSEARVLDKLANTVKNVTLWILIYSSDRKRLMREIDLY